MDGNFLKFHFLNGFESLPSFEEKITLFGTNSCSHRTAKEAWPIGENKKIAVASMKNFIPILLQAEVLLTGIIASFKAYMTNYAGQIQPRRRLILRHVMLIGSLAEIRSQNSDFGRQNGQDFSAKFLTKLNLFYSFFRSKYLTKHLIWPYIFVPEKNMKVQNLKFAMLVSALCSLLMSCSGSGGGGNGAGGGGATPGTPVKNFELTISSANCMSQKINPFKSPQENLENFIGFGDASCVKKVIEAGADVNKPIITFGSGEKVLPLFKAISDSSMFFTNANYKVPWAVIKVLIDAGADVKQVNLQTGNTALQDAIAAMSFKKDYVTAIEYMVFTGKFDLNAKNRSGENAIHMAINAELNDTISLMLDKPADFEAKNPAGDTPLQMAIRHKLDTVGLKFVDKVNSVDQQTSGQNTALHLAVDYGFENLAIKIASKSKNIELKNQSADTGLLKSVRARMVALTAHLLNLGADADANNGSQSVIHIALTQQQSEIVDFILGAAKKIEAKDSNGFSPLLLAAQYGTYDQVNFLLNKGASVNSLTADGRNALHLTNNLNVAQLLISKNIDINAISKAGESPLSTRLRDDKGDSVARQLIDSGASLTFLTPDKESLLDLALRSRKSALAEYLLEKKVDPNTIDINGENAVFNATTAADIQLLATYGAKIDIKNKRGKTPLVEFVINYHTHVQKETFAMIRKLLELGANPNVATYDLVLNSVTAMPYSTDGASTYSNAYDSSELLTLLVYYHASIKNTDTAGNTALHLADTVGEIAFLRQNGIDTKAKNYDGLTALEARQVYKNTLEDKIETNEALIKSYKETIAKELAKPTPDKDIIALTQSELNKVTAQNDAQKTRLAIVEKLIAALN